MAKHSKRGYALAHFRVALGAIICTLFTEATGPTNPVLWPVTLGEDTFLFCVPLHRQLHTVREAAWRLYNRTHNNWLYLMGIDRSQKSNQNTWQFKLGVDIPSRYSLWGVNKMFLKIENVTEKDNGTEYRCNTFGGKPEALHFILILLDPEKASPPTRTLQATTTTWSAYPPTSTLQATTTTWSENTPITNAQPTTDQPVTEGCLVWKAFTGAISAVAIILICYLLCPCGERLLNVARVYWERLLTAVQDLFGHQDNRSSGDVIHGEEISGERASTERPTAADASKVNCSDGETTSLGTEESYPYEAFEMGTNCGLGHNILSKLSFRL